MIEVLNYNALSQLDLKDFVFVNNRPVDDPTSVFFCYFEETKLAGMLRVNIADACAWFSYIEVLVEFRKKGVASSLIKYLFIYCRSNRIKKLAVSHFTPEGALAVKPTLERIAKNYHIEVVMDKR
jgi:GNAT superfamily N-acetyltransferase